MKKISFIFFVIILGIISISCDDSVNPKTEFKEKYVLNCIINMDTTYQVATVSKTFDVAGYDQYSNTNDPFISNAVVQITYNNSVLTLKDTSKIRTDTSRYKTPLSFYYLENFKKAQQTLPLTITAQMPDGTILYGSTNIYSLSRFYVGSNKREIFAPQSSLESAYVDVSFEWGDLYSAKTFSDIYYSSEFVILYSHESNGVVENLEKKIAWYYIGDSPVYPRVNTGEKYIRFPFENIDKALREISKDDPNKQNYKIKGALFRILLMDNYLAAYYSSQKTFLDEFSVRVNQPDFSNVHNGLGIIGTYAVKKLQIKIDPGYISSFGYNF